MKVVNSGHFKPGQGKPKGSGRKKGSKNKYKLPNVAETLSKRDINPFDKLIDLAEDPKTTPDDKRKIYTVLAGYSAPRPRADHENQTASSTTSGESDQEIGQLLSLVRPNPAKKAGSGENK